MGDRILEEAVLAEESSIFRTEEELAAEADDDVEYKNEDTFGDFDDVGAYSLLHDVSVQHSYSYSRRRL